MAEQLFGVWASFVGDVAGSSIAHNLKFDCESGKDAEPGVSFVNGVVLCAVLYGPDVVSGAALGTGGRPTVGVIFAETFRPSASVT